MVKLDAPCGCRASIRLYYMLKILKLEIVLYSAVLRAPNCVSLVLAVDDAALQAEPHRLLLCFQLSSLD